MGSSISNQRQEIARQDADGNPPPSYFLPAMRNQYPLPTTKMPTATGTRSDEDGMQSQPCTVPTCFGGQNQHVGIHSSTSGSRVDITTTDTTALPDQQHDAVSSLLPVQDSEKRTRGGQRGKRNDSKKWEDLATRDRTTLRRRGAGSATTKSLVPNLHRSSTEGPTTRSRAGKTNHASTVQAGAVSSVLPAPPPIIIRPSAKRRIDIIRSLLLKFFCFSIFCFSIFSCISRSL